MRKAAKVQAKKASTFHLPSETDIQNFIESNCITIHESKDSENSISPIMDFQQLRVPSCLLAILSNFDKPTPIQACSWPALLNGSDVIGIAETGR